MNCEESAVHDVLSETMVTEIWKGFPEDLFETVIARLPIAALFRFRSVCQRWRNLVTSQSFSRQCTEVPQLPWFCGITRERPYNGVMFDLSIQKRYLTSFPFIDESMILLPETSAGGLVCFTDIMLMHFYVCNPLTHSFKKLPPRPLDPVRSSCTVGMTLDGDSASEGYRIMWLEEHGGNHRVYNSKQNCWTNLHPMPSHIKLPLSLNVVHQPIAIGSTLYIIRAAPDGIVSYDTVSGDWKQYIVPLPSDVTDHSLVKCGGRIMLVGLLTNAATCVCIWELQKMALLWKEVDGMPDVLSLNFYGRQIKMCCLGNQDVIMLSLKSLQRNYLVIYSLLTKEWQMVPSGVLSGRKNNDLSLWVRSFLPSPTAFP